MVEPDRISVDVRWTPAEAFGVASAAARVAVRHIALAFVAFVGLGVASIAYRRWGIAEYAVLGAIVIAMLAVRPIAVWRRAPRRWVEAGTSRVDIDRAGLTWTREDGTWSRRPWRLVAWRTNVRGALLLVQRIGLDAVVIPASALNGDARTRVERLLADVPVGRTRGVVVPAPAVDPAPASQEAGDVVAAFTYGFGFAQARIAPVTREERVLASLMAVFLAGATVVVVALVPVVFDAGQWVTTALFGGLFVFVTARLPDRRRNERVLRSLDAQKGTAVHTTFSERGVHERIGGDVELFVPWTRVERVAEIDGFLVVQLAQSDARIPVPLAALGDGGAARVHALEATGAP